VRRSAVAVAVSVLGLVVLPGGAIGDGPYDFSVGGGTSTTAVGGTTHLAFAAHSRSPGFGELVPSGDALLNFQDLSGFQDFDGAAQAVVQLTQTGAGPTGQVRAKGDLDGDAGPLAPFALEGPVTCLAVQGNHASIFYEFKHAEPAFLEGGGIQIFIEDNGPPVNGHSVDGSAFEPPIPGPPPGAPPFEGPTVCPPPPTTGYMPADTGNFIVHDAVP